VSVSFHIEIGDLSALAYLPRFEPFLGAAAAHAVQWKPPNAIGNSESKAMSDL
jgi:hypothetical protein